MPMGLISDKGRDIFVDMDDREGELLLFWMRRGWTASSSVILESHSRREVRVRKGTNE